MSHRDDVLVTTDWLDKRLEDSRVRIVEVDEDPFLYDRGHIPGAVRWSWYEDLRHPVQREYRDRAGIRDLLERSGVGADTTVVLYSARGNWFAAYAYWLLRYRGFQGARLLDGGRTRWEWEGRPLETADSLPDRDRLGELGPEQCDLRMLRDDVLGAVRRQNGVDPVFVDVRSPEEYRGELLAPPELPQERSYVAGHIPGAVNIPWSLAARDDGRFREDEELRELYADVLERERLVTYCRIGERAAHTWFVLHELLGHRHVANYDGSWTEYGSLVGVPVER